MKTKQPLLLAIALCASLSAAAAATMPVIYPAKGQSTAQTDRDKLACYDWSRAQSGFDPMQPPQQVPQPQPQQQQAAAQGGGSTTGMVKGAATGAAVAELTHGDAGKGAAIGVLGSGMRERMKQQQQMQQQQAQQQQQQQQQQQAALAQRKATFERAFGACMEGRGYVVK